LLTNELVPGFFSGNPTWWIYSVAKIRLGRLKEKETKLKRAAAVKNS